MNNTYPSLFFGYTIFWLLLAAYLFWCGMRLARAERRIAELTLREDVNAPRN